MHPHRSSALGYASAASAAHSRVYGACAAEAAASESSGLSVGGCPRAWRYFRPYPVFEPFCASARTCYDRTQPTLLDVIPYVNTPSPTVYMYVASLFTSGTFWSLQEEESE